MDDSCAVCAESLEWVAYGSCGHKEVCSTCVARLRFICDDRRCCICKTESPVVFVTKALGDYTKMINDFSVLPTEVKEGRAGSYWYHEDTQAYFDDLDHYNMIKAMCRLSCSVCDRMEEHATDGPKRRARFRSIDQLKGHLFHQHRMLMCSLCLEGRKVFICEQKLYSREQLKQHIHTGDSDVDGTENERGGFMGHPLCEFCRSPFYGDNELFTHMSTEHYTCHICQRQHPGQYEYYKNYDDLEIHFRHEHFLCEDESCLAKKFIVFQSEAEMKRHNTLEHGGRMSRSQRNAALQIPTSFQYRRNNEQDNRHGRGRGRGRGRGLAFRRDASDADLSRAIEASFETAQSSNAPVISDHGETSGVDPIIQPFESLATTDLEPPSRYLQAVSHRPRNTPLEESSFPPLVSAPAVSQQRSIPDYEGLQNPFPPLSSAPAGSQQRPIPNHEGVQNPFPPLASAPAGSQQRPIPIPNHEGLQNSFPPLASAPSGSQQRPIPDYEGLQKNTMAENLRRQNKKKVSVLNSTQANSGQAWPAASRAHVAQAATPVHPRPNTDSFPGLLPTSGQSKPAINPRSARSSYSSSVQAPSVSVHEPLSTGFLTSSNNRGNTSRISHSSSAPNLVEAGSTSDFPPVSAAVQTRNQPADGQVMQKVEDVYTANKSMVERIRSALDFDQDKYAAFKEISGEYRQGLIDAATYLAYAQQFGLSHLVLDLARLCPDPNKERELVAAYNAAQVNKSPQENGQLRGTIKGKNAVSQSSNVKENLADSILSTVRKLQSNYKPSEEEVETLSKDGYRTSKGKSKVVVDERRAESNSPGLTILKGKGGEADFRFDGGGSNQSTGDGDGKSKQRKKTSKFHRVRLGDGSIAALLDAKHSDPDSDSTNAVSDGGNDTGEGLPVRGVWRNGGGHKLVAMTSKDPHK